MVVSRCPGCFKCKDEITKVFIDIERRFNFNFFGNSDVDLSQSFAFHSRTLIKIIRLYCCYLWSSYSYKILLHTEKEQSSSS